MLVSLRRGNLLLAFLLELAMLAAFCFVGWTLGTATWMKAGLAIGLPAIAIVLWAMYAAPRARKRRLKMPRLLIFKVCIFVAASAAWWAAGQAFVASIFGALVVINALGMGAFKQY